MHSPAFTRWFGGFVVAAVASTLCLTHLALAEAPADKLPPPGKKKVSYERDIQPLFANFCYECHEKKQEGGLRLDKRSRALNGGDSGEVLTSGDSTKSLLIELVAALDL